MNLVILLTDIGVRRVRHTGHCSELWVVE